MKKSLPNLLLSSMILLLSFCSNPNETNPYISLRLSDSLTLQFRDTLFNNEENFWITFDSLLADSRCPVDAICLWEGNAELGFTFAKDGNEIPFSLNTHVDFLRDTTLLGYKVSLIDVMPYPHTDSSFTQKDYSTVIVISN